MASKSDTTRKAQTRAEDAQKRGKTSSEAEREAWKAQTTEAGPGQAPKRHEGRSGKKAGSGRKG